MWGWDESGRGRRFAGISILGAAVIITVGLFLFLQPQTPAATQQLSQTVVSGGQPMLPTKQLTINTTTLTVEMATTPQQEEQGLSGRTGLAEGAGMLFVFDPPKTPGFWMKDMRFPLDIIFAKEDGTIVTIYKNISPDTYPQHFSPSEAVRYVLEVPAGFAAAHAIAEGQKIVVQ